MNGKSPLSDERRLRSVWIFWKNWIRFVGPAHPSFSLWLQLGFVVGITWYKHAIITPISWDITHHYGLYNQLCPQAGIQYGLYVRNSNHSGVKKSCQDSFPAQNL